jgi:hypothetical protein
LLQSILNLSFSSQPLSSLEQKNPGGCMENRDERAVGATGEVESTEGVARSEKEWVAPELRKIDIKEITANGGILSADGITSS